METLTQKRLFEDKFISLVSCIKKLIFRALQKELLITIYVVFQDFFPSPNAGLISSITVLLENFQLVASHRVERCGLCFMHKKPDGPKIPEKAFNNGLSGYSNSSFLLITGLSSSIKDSIVSFQLVIEFGMKSSVFKILSSKL